MPNIPIKKYNKPLLTYLLSKRLQRNKSRKLVMQVCDLQTSTARDDDNDGLQRERKVGGKASRSEPDAAHAVDSFQVETPPSSSSLTFVCRYCDQVATDS